MKPRSTSSRLAMATTMTIAFCAIALIVTGVLWFFVATWPYGALAAALLALLWGAFYWFVPIGDRLFTEDE